MTTGRPWWRAPRAHGLVWALVVSGGFLFLLATELLGSRGTVMLDDYGCAAAPAVAAGSCWRARRHTEARSRRAWTLMAASCASWAAGGVIWTVYEVHLGRPLPFPSPADLGYLASVPLAVAALLSFPAARRDRARFVSLLDGVIAAAALLFVSWLTVLKPAVASSTGSSLAHLMALAYPIGDIVTATMGLLLWSRARGAQRVAVSLVGAGLLVIAVADSAFAWFSTQGRYATGNLFDTGYVLGFLLIAVAARSGTAEGHGAEVREDREGIPARAILALPYLPVLVGVMLVVGRELEGHALGGGPLLVGLVVVTAILVRQLLSLLVNEGLSRELHDTISELRGREAQLHHQAFHDGLTGLANRALFHDRLGHALLQRASYEPVTLLLIDLDNFKGVNDTHGHPTGDRLLVKVAERLRGALRPGDTAARLGGDEFAVLLESGGLAGADQVATRVADALARPLQLADAEVATSASIGVAVAGPLTTAEELLRDADVAMYAAKSNGKAQHAVYASERAAVDTDQRRLAAELRTALAEGQFHLKYQPVVDLGSGRVSGVEALLRWRHPVRGDISPSTFIPLAEDSGDIVAIGAWVIRQATAQAGRWHRMCGDGAPLRLSVNVSGRQLGEPGLLQTIASALASADLPPQLLTLEITESMVLEEVEARGPLLALRGLGVLLAIDDFGTGHSALSRLRTYPFDILKIDQSFVAALDRDPGSADALLKAIVALGEGLDVAVVAEGVETEDQLTALHVVGCTGAQGFLFARPADPEVIDDLVRGDLQLADPLRLRHRAGTASGTPQR